eukprot:4620470-Amphidinium_carterae.1
MVPSAHCTISASPEASIESGLHSTCAGVSPSKEPVERRLVDHCYQNLIGTSLVLLLLLSAYLGSSLKSVVFG